MTYKINYLQFAMKTEVKCLCILFKNLGNINKNNFIIQINEIHAKDLEYRETFMRKENRSEMEPIIIVTLQRILIILNTSTFAIYTVSISKRRIQKTHLIIISVSNLTNN